MIAKICLPNLHIATDTDLSHAQLGAPEHNSVEASETASSTNSVSGNSPVPGQTANLSNHSTRSDTASYIQLGILQSRAGGARQELRVCVLCAEPA